MVAKPGSPDGAGVDDAELVSLILSSVPRLRCVVYRDIFLIYFTMPTSDIENSLERIKAAAKIPSLLGSGWGTSSEWERPESVDLKRPNVPGMLTALIGGAAEKFVGKWRAFPLGPELHVQPLGLAWASQIQFDLNPERVVHPGTQLLAMFLRLGKASDEQVRTFAATYGALGIFGRSQPDGHGHIEYCEAWRYIVRAMLALWRIGNELSLGRHGDAQDWKRIADPMCDSLYSYTSLFSFSLKDAAEIQSPGEKQWLLVMEYLNKPGRRPRKHEERLIFTVLLNALLGMGAVQSRVLWPNRNHDPRFVHSPGQSLLSYLALQLSIDILQLRVLSVCNGCDMEYKPNMAPKHGQRNFCKDCRDKGIPQKYALRAFRERQREARRNKRR